MHAPDRLERAPERGRYDRHATVSERLNVQRSLIEQAIRTLLVHLHPHTMTVTQLSKATGLGRNTLYGHFPSIETACQSVVEDCWQELAAELALRPLASSTPMTLCDELSRRWLGAAAAQPEALRILFRCQPDRLAAQLSSELEDLWSLGAKAGAFAPVPDPVRIRALRASLLQLLDEVSRQGATAEHCATVMSDLLMRCLR